MTQPYKIHTSSHWYDGDGEPHHEAGLKDARDQGLFPSVTSIMKDVLAKPALITWMKNQAVFSALTLPRIPGESDNDFASRAAEDSNKQSSEAAEFGTRIHKAIEGLETGEPLEEELRPYLESYAKWRHNEVESVLCNEKTLVSKRLGFAGTVDMIAIVKGLGFCIIDFKTQGVKKKAAFYPDWCYQLSAYSQMAFENGIIHTPFINGVSIVINSTKPDDIAIRVWNPEEMSEGFEVFQCLAYVWSVQKKHWPVGKWNMVCKTGQ